MLPLLLFLLQADPRSLDDAVAAFAKGDAAARQTVLKAGSSSILPLRKVRSQAAEKIDALIYEIKTLADGAPPQAILNALDAPRSMEVGEVAFEVAVDDLSNGLPLLFDPALFQSHWGKNVVLNLKDRPRREILESLCRQLDLDFGFFYDVVLIAAPGRLWPAARPQRAVPLTREESTLAATLIERLASEKLQEREEAFNFLKKLGKGAIPLIEKGANHEDAERRARCVALVKELTDPPTPATFHRPAAAQQKLTGADEDLRARLAENRVSFKVQDIVLDGAMRLLLQPRDIPVQLAPGLKDVRLTLDLQNQTSWTVICLATHCCGFDFLIRDGRLVIDTREEIQHCLAKGR